MEQTVDSKKISNIIAARKTILSLLQGDITYKLISLAKDIDGLDFQHVGYVTEKIIERIDKKDLENVSKETIEQIINKKYDINLKRKGIKQITLVGIAFHGKLIKVSCMDI